jgi:hypothetical protein
LSDQPAPFIFNQPPLSYWVRLRTPVGVFTLVDKVSTLTPRVSIFEQGSGVIVEHMIIGRKCVLKSEREMDEFGRLNNRISIKNSVKIHTWRSLCR